MKAVNGFAVCLLLILMVLTVTGCNRPLLETGAAVREGQPAPSFKLKDLNGREVSLAQYRGKIVMLDFWATWCGPCRMTMPLLENLKKEYPNQLALLAINLQESPDVVRDYVLQQNLHSDILLDEEGSVGGVYGTGSIPMQVLIDKNGIVRHIQIGFAPGRTLDQLRSAIDKLL